MEKIVFESWGEFLDRCANGKCALTEGKRRSRADGEYSWFGTHDFKDAMDLAVNGWEEGANMATKIAEPMFTHISSMIEKQEIVYDVEGQGLDIGRYLDGEPEHWQRIEIEEGQGPGHKIIKIVLNICVSSGIEARVIRQKGAAIQALVNLLEFAGHRCEVWTMAAVRGGGETREVWMLLKRASENVDASRLAFGLAHPSMFRRMIFALWETMGDVERLQQFGIPERGYGSVAKAVSEKGDIYLGGSQYGRDEFESDGATEEWIIEQLKAHGVHLKKKEAAL